MGAPTCGQPLFGQPHGGSQLCMSLTCVLQETHTCECGAARQPPLCCHSTLRERGPWGGGALVWAPTLNSMNPLRAQPCPPLSVQSLQTLSQKPTEPDPEASQPVRGCQRGQLMFESNSKSICWEKALGGALCDSVRVTLSLTVKSSKCTRSSGGLRIRLGGNPLNQKNSKNFWLHSSRLKQFRNPPPHIGVPDEMMSSRQVLRMLGCKDWTEKQPEN